MTEKPITLEMPASILRVLNDVLSQSQAMPILGQRVAGWLEGQGLLSDGNIEITVNSATISHVAPVSPNGVIHADTGG